MEKTALEKGTEGRLAMTFIAKAAFVAISTDGVYQTKNCCLRFYLADDIPARTSYLQFSKNNLHFYYSTFVRIFQQIGSSP